MTKHFAFLALAAAALSACEQNRSITNPAAAIASSLQAQHNSDGSGGSDGPGAVYTLTNQVAGNAVAVFTRGADGRLTAPARLRRAVPARARVSARKAPSR